jgi:glycosyltransferase involved in cell wall biosynthesis
LEPVLIALGEESRRQKVLLMGQGSEEYRAALVRKSPSLADLLYATGALDAANLSCHVAACDLLIQPYSDGVSCRRSSFMVGLSHGKPLVTNLGALSEPFWRDTQALALALAADTETLLGLLHQVGTDAAERDRMGQAARKLYQERFDISYTVAALRESESSDRFVCAS